MAQQSELEELRSLNLTDLTGVEGGGSSQPLFVVSLQKSSIKSLVVLFLACSLPDHMGSATS